VHAGHVTQAQPLTMVFPVQVTGLARQCSVQYCFVQTLDVAVSPVWQLA
jgi:hypothetical protein